VVGLSDKKWGARNYFGG